MTLRASIPVLKVTNGLGERLLNIDTRGVAELEKRSAEHFPYAASSYLGTRAVLNRLRLGSRDVVIDIGCGKGRVVCIAAQYAVRGVIGIDTSADLLAAAEKNAAALRRQRAPITFVRASAYEFDYSDVTALYLFNPFGPATMMRTLARINETRSGPVRIAYVNPVYDGVLHAAPWLGQIDWWKGGSRFALRADVSFWRAG